MARRELGPATLAVVQAVDAALIPAGVRLVVACSGGADSLALSYAVGHLARRREWAWTAVVVDHQLQPGSAEVAARARDQLDDLGCPDVQVLRVDVDPDARGGPEAAARDARYAALATVARRIGGTVLLGHTLDDQAETVLLGLARGSGLRSLAGMAVRSGSLLRPLLALRRVTTVQTCHEIGLDPWSDPHNEDPRFTRVRVRQRVLPTLEAELGPGAAESLARTAALARDDTDLLDRLAAEADPGTDELAADLLLALPRALRTRVIRRWLARLGAVEVTLSHVIRVEDLVTQWRGQGQADLPGLSVRRVQGSLRTVP
ncbi:MAG TPA: tRNA lysidine(34) synthetase TilS [Propionibacteriaceae bacterium]